jgi:hypothetical protein
MTTRSTKPTTRETSAYVRDKGMRPVLVTIQGGILEFRAKGLRSREILDVAWCYETAVKSRLAHDRAQRKSNRKNGVRK